MMRWITSSTVPPKYPETPPKVTPRMKVRNTATRPIESEMRAPAHVRENRSRDRRSEPKTKIGVPSTPNRWMSVLMNPSITYGSPRKKN